MSILRGALLKLILGNKLISHQSIKKIMEMMEFELGTEDRCRCEDSSTIPLPWPQYSDEISDQR